MSPGGRSRGGLPSTMSSSTRRTAPNDSSARASGDRQPGSRRSSSLSARAPDAIKAMSERFAIGQVAGRAVPRQGQPTPPSLTGRPPPLSRDQQHPVEAHRRPHRHCVPRACSPPGPARRSARRGRRDLRQGVEFRAILVLRTPRAADPRMVLARGQKPGAWVRDGRLHAEGAASAAGPRSRRPRSIQARRLDGRIVAVRPSSAGRQPGRPAEPKPPRRHPAFPGRPPRSRRMRCRLPCHPDKMSSVSISG